MIARIASLGFATCLLDVDVAFVGRAGLDPVGAMLAAGRGADLALSTNAPQSEWNTGAAFFRSSARTSQLLRRWLARNAALVEAPRGQLYHGTQKYAYELVPALLACVQHGCGTTTCCCSRCRTAFERK